MSVDFRKDKKPKRGVIKRGGKNIQPTEADVPKTAENAKEQSNTEIPKPTMPILKPTKPIAQATPEKRKIVFAYLNKFINSLQHLYQKFLSQIQN